MHDDTKLFEMLILETFQAGLSWLTILKKRQAFAQAFASFNYQQVSQYGSEQIAELLQNKQIIRNQKKIEAAINNANAFGEVVAEYGSFASYFWGFTNGKILQPKYKEHTDMLAQSELSQKIAKTLKQKGFKFVGPIVIQSHMEACGMLNAHITSCFRHNDLA